MPRKIVVEMNQQQEELVDRLVREGGLGSTRGEVIAAVFRQFRIDHPELVASGSGSDDA